VTNLETDSWAVVRFLHQAGDGGTADQRAQAGSENARAELSSVPLQQSAAVAELDGVGPGEPLAAGGAVEEDRQLVADELAAAGR